MRPLKDVRVVAVEQYGAGPFGTLHLAELGAEVIKIEDPKSGGDVARYVPPSASQDDSLFFQSFNRNKRSLTLDLATAAGYEVFLDLVAASDAVYSNLRGDIPPKIGLTYQRLRHVNPRIVCCSLSGFGMTGPRAAEPAYDYILQGLAGWMSLTGEPDGPPAKSGLSLVDYSGGLVAALALVAGVHAARRDGVGMDCDLSLFDVAIGMLTYPATWLLSTGHETGRTRHSAHPSIVPFQAFPTADGWMVVACPKEKFWRRLCEVVGVPDLCRDPKFRDFAARRRNRAELVGILEEIFAGRTTGEWLPALTGAGVPSGPVNSVAQALDDPQTEARGMIVKVDHPTFGAMRQPASPVRVGEPREEHSPAPGLNADADAVLGSLLRYDSEQVERLADAGAFGDSS